MMSWFKIRLRTVSELAGHIGGHVFADGNVVIS